MNAEAMAGAVTTVTLARTLPRTESSVNVPVDLMRATRATEVVGRM